MKKTIAAGGAGVLGLVSAALGAAAPAQADVVTGPACTDNTEHGPSATPLANWYMDCVPQFGSATVNFDIVSDIDFPAEFEDIFNETVSTTAAAPAADAYFNLDPASNGVLENFRFFADPQRQGYAAAFAMPVSSVESLLPADLPAECAGETYTGVYRVNYAPTTVMFTQVIDGEEWRYDVVLTPEPLTLGLNVVNGVFDSAAAMCAASGTDVLFGEDGNSSDWSQVADIASGSFPFTLSPYFGEGKTLPDVSRYVPPVPEPEKPALAATGVDASVPLGAAAILLGLGAGALAISRRRRVS